MAPAAKSLPDASTHVLPLQGIASRAVRGAGIVGALDRADMCAACHVAVQPPHHLARRASRQPRHSLTFLHMKGLRLPQLAVPQPHAAGEPYVWLELAPAP